MSGGGNHKWGEFDDEMAARAEDPRDHAVYGKVGGFAGAEGRGEAHAGVDSKYYNAEASVEASNRSGFGASAEGYADASTEALLRDGKVSAGGRVDADASLVNAHVAAHVGVGGGPAIGGIDPATGKRKHMAHASGDASADAFVGAQGGAAGEAYFTGLSAGVAGRAGVEAAARVKGAVSGEAALEVGGFNLAAIKGSADGTAEVRAGADADGEASISLLRGGFAKGDAKAEAMARVSGNASATLGVGGIHERVEAHGTAEAGAMAGAGGAIALGNPANAGAGGRAEAFAGARASGKVNGAIGYVGVDVFTMELNGSVAAGAGAGVGGGMLIKDGVLTINLEALAACGVGGSLGGAFTVDFLSPFKMVLKLLEQNGVISSNPEEWVANIIGIGLDPEAWKERMAGGFDRDTTVDVGTSGDGIGGLTGEASGYAGKKKGSVSGHVGSESSVVNVPKPKTKTGGGGDGAVTSTHDAFDRYGPVAGGAQTAAGPVAKAAVDPAASGAQSVAEATRDLAQAHQLSTEAAVESQTALRSAMTTVMNGAADPVKLVASILKGAATAIQELVNNGVKGASALAGSIMQAAQNAINAIARLILDFLRAIFSGDKPDLSGGFNEQRHHLDQVFAGNAKAIKGAFEQVKTQHVGQAKKAIQDGFMALGTSFVAASGGDLSAAQTKAQQAQALTAKVAAKPIQHDGGAVTAPDAKAATQVGEVAGLVGQMAGKAKEQPSTISHAGATGASHLDSAAPGLAASAGAAEDAMAAAYEQPRDAKQQEVDHKKAEGEERWDRHPKGKKRGKRH